MSQEQRDAKAEYMQQLASMILSNTSAANWQLNSVSDNQTHVEIVHRYIRNSVKT